MSPNARIQRGAPKADAEKAMQPPATRGASSGQEFQKSGNHVDHPLQMDRNDQLICVHRGSWCGIGSSNDTPHQRAGSRLLDKIHGACWQR